MFEFPVDSLDDGPHGEPALEDDPGLPIDNADGQNSGVQIDAAVESVLVGVETQSSPPWHGAPIVVGKTRSIPRRFHAGTRLALDPFTTWDGHRVRPFSGG